MTFYTTFLDSTFDSGLWSEWLLEVQGVHEVKRCPSECRIVLRKRFLLGQIQQVFCQLEHFFETLSDITACLSPHLSLCLFSGGLLPYGHH